MDEEIPRSRMRAADSDRERVAEQLRSAHADGRLDFAEFAMGWVYPWWIWVAGTWGAAPLTRLAGERVNFVKLPR